MNINIDTNKGQGSQEIPVKVWFGNVTVNLKWTYDKVTGILSCDVNV
jgi:hypothetical protein